MKKGIITASIILVGLMLAVILATPKSVAQVSISDLHERKSIEVKAPWGILRGGAIYVFAEGELSGKGNLHIYSNHGRDHQVHTFENERIRIQVNEPEAWVDDLQVEWEPIDVKKGKIELFIGCGDGFSELQEWTRKNQPV